MYDIITFLSPYILATKTNNNDINSNSNNNNNNLYSPPNIVRVIKSRRMRWAGHVAHMGEERGMYRVLVGKPEGRKSLGRPRRRWVDNIRMDLQEVECVCMDWMVWPRIETGGGRL